MTRHLNPLRLRHLATTVACVCLTVALPGTAAAQGRPLSPSSSKRSAMTEVRCADDPLSRSACMIRIILDDVTKAGGEIGGGIPQIKAASSTAYTVSLPREERIQQITYQFTVGKGVVTLSKRTESTQGF